MPFVEWAVKAAKSVGPILKDFFFEKKPAASAPSSSSGHNVFLIADEMEFRGKNIRLMVCNGPPPFPPSSNPPPPQVTNG
jgi:hypothetical protein